MRLSLLNQSWYRRGEEKEVGVGGGCERLAEALSFAVAAYCAVALGGHTWPSAASDTQGSAHDRHAARAVCRVLRVCVRAHMDMCYARGALPALISHQSS